MATIAAPRRGGSWILDESGDDEIFTPERLSDEQRMMARTSVDFITQEVLPQLDALEAKDWALARKFVKRCGELGLLGTDVPEIYGGVELDKVSSVVVAEGIARAASFGTTFGAMTGLSICPLLCFGTEAQKQKYLPGLVSGDVVGAYALSESGSGSDALGAKTRATRQADGSFLLNGEKMWITSSSFADLFIVFAKVDGEHFTAFIVERTFPGVSSGKEEHKLGLHGSSTAPLILQDARVPAENLLGEIGKGHRVAFNVLNYGRFKLGAMMTGGAKSILIEATTYAATRKQFGKPIASFGAIKHKIAEMTTRLYAIESLLYRTAGLIDDTIAQRKSLGAAGLGTTGPAATGPAATGSAVAATAAPASATAAGATPAGASAGSTEAAIAAAAQVAALEEFAVEASIAKVAGSEMLHYVVDENVQIHGGNGYVHDYPAERHYRDSRVNRIFEGTNEINRLLIPGMLMRRAIKGDFGLIPAAKRLQDEILSPSMEMPGDETLEAERFAIRGFKKVALVLLGTAMQTYGEKVSDEQEILSWTADVLMDTFAADSAVQRAAQADASRQATAALQIDAARLFVNDAAMRIDAAARQAVAAMADGDDLRLLLGALRRLLKVTPINTVEIRRRIADAAVSRRGYIFA